MWVGLFAVHDPDAEGVSASTMALISLAGSPSLWKLQHQLVLPLTARFSLTHNLLFPPRWRAYWRFCTASEVQAWQLRQLTSDEIRVSRWRQPPTAVPSRKTWFPRCLTSPSPRRGICFFTRMSRERHQRCFLFSLQLPSPSPSPLFSPLAFISPSVSLLPPVSQRSCAFIASPVAS